MRLTFYVIFVSFLMLSCSSKENKSSKDSIRDDKKITKEVLSLGSDFSPFFVNSTDSLFFVFSKRIAFDTSWILVIKKSGDSLYAYYNQILPSYHRDVHDFLDESSALLSYEGLTFSFANTKLIDMLNKSGVDSLSKAVTDSITCIHCPYYAMYFNARVYQSTRQNQPILDTINKVLKIDLLNGLLEKARKPRW